MTPCPGCLSERAVDPPPRYKHTTTTAAIPRTNYDVRSVSITQRRPPLLLEPVALYLRRDGGSRDDSDSADGDRPPEVELLLGEGPAFEPGAP